MITPITGWIRLPILVKISITFTFPMKQPARLANRQQLYLVLTYKEFYGVSSTIANPFVHISHYDFEDILLALILINNSSENSVDETININETLVARLPVFKALRLRYYMNRTDSGKFQLTNGTVISKIVTDLFGILPQEGEFLPSTDLHFEEYLLDIILIYNEKQFPEVGTNGKVQTHQSLWKLMLMQNITGLNNIHYARTANVKHTIFIQFLKDALQEKFEELESDFKRRTGMNGLYTPALTLLNLFGGIENKYRELGNPIVLIEKSEDTYTFLKSFGIVFNKNMAASHRGGIGFYITHPFYDHSDGRIYLVDHSNFAFAVDRGWFFYLYHHSNLCKLLSGVKDFESFLGHLGKHYFESYLVGGMLTKLHRPGFRVITTNDRELSDATLILNEKDVFMIEVKSHALHANVIDQMDVVGLQEFVNEKFASDKKGAGQLARLIRSFGDNTNDSLEIRQPKNKLTIYPIIIYTEQHLEKYGFGDYVAEKFHLLLTEYIHPFRDIKPLVMIHYDFFVENISLLEQRPSLLKSAINRYLSYISGCCTTNRLLIRYFD